MRESIKKTDIRGVGKRLKEGEVETDIVEYILNNSSKVSTPNIRAFLKNKHGLHDRTSIDEHLSFLLDENCIKKFSSKRGFKNHWDVKSLKHLKNIKQQFKEIELQTYKKSVNIIIKELFFDVSPDNKSTLIKQLSSSTSFFDVCMKTETDIGALYAKAEEIYQHREGFEMAQEVKEFVKNLYTEFMKRISMNYNIQPIGNNKYTNDSSKLYFDQHSQKYSSNIEVSENRFRKLLEEISIMSWKDVSAEELEQRIIREISLKIASEIFQKTLAAVPTEFLKISEKLLNAISDEIFERLMKENIEDMCCYFLGLKLYQRMARKWSPYMILEHCFYQDILNGTVSPQEKDVVSKEKDIVDKERDFVYKNKMRAAELSATCQNKPIVIQQNNYHLYTLIKQMDCMF
jgi:hypothetical protein